MNEEGNNMTHNAIYFFEIYKLRTTSQMKAHFRGNTTTRKIPEKQVPITGKALIHASAIQNKKKLFKEIELAD